jgi:hypothetical protein
VILAYLAYLGRNLAEAAKFLRSIVLTGPDYQFLRQLSARFGPSMSDSELERLSDLLDGRA